MVINTNTRTVESFDTLCKRDDHIVGTATMPGSKVETGAAEVERRGEERVGRVYRKVARDDAISRFHELIST